MKVTTNATTNTANVGDKSLNTISWSPSQLLSPLASNALAIAKPPPNNIMMPHLVAHGAQSLVLVKENAVSMVEKQQKGTETQTDFVPAPVPVEG